MNRKDVRKRPNARLFGALCFALTMLVLSRSSIAQEECELVYDPTAREDEELLERLRSDPFAESFTGYIRVLEEVVAEADEQERYARNWSSDVCRPYVARRTQHEIDVASYESRCSGELTDQSTYENCLRSFDQLNSRKSALDVEFVRVNRGLERVNTWADELVEKGKKPREEARFILDERNSDEALWLFAEKMRREESSDCAAMAKIIGALGRKVSSVDDLIGLAGAIIGGGERNPYAYSSDRQRVQFGSSGFKQSYVDVSDQVAHFVAYFSFGTKHDSRRFREFFTDCRDLACDSLLCRLLGGAQCEFPDYKLGIVAAELGNRVKNNPSLMKGNLEGYVYGTACR